MSCFKAIKIHDKYDFVFALHISFEITSTGDLGHTCVLILWSEGSIICQDSTVFTKDYDKIRVLRFLWPHEESCLNHIHSKSEFLFKCRNM